MERVACLCCRCNTSFSSEGASLLPLLLPLPPPLPPRPFTVCLSSQYLLELVKMCQLCYFEKIRRRELAEKMQHILMAVVWCSVFYSARYCFLHGGFSPRPQRSFELNRIEKESSPLRHAAREMDATMSEAWSTVQPGLHHEAHCRRQGER